MDNRTIKASVYYGMGSLRKNNEDAYYFNGQYASYSHMDREAFLFSEADADGSLWAVCDGMGGQSNGEKASFTAVSGLRGLQEHLPGRDFETTVQSWVSQANDAVNEQADGGGSTLAMLYCSGPHLRAAHVGDSRIYRYHNGQLERITRDHSRVEMLLDAGAITQEEARNHPQKSVVTRYLGMNSEYVCTASVSEEIPYLRGDRYLLCSDGVTDMLTDDEISALLAEPGEIGSCVGKIRDAVFTAGARDNLTVILLELAGPENA